MDKPNFIAQEQGLNFDSVVEAIIKRSCIIDYGIIQEVRASGVVDVSVAVAKTEQAMLCMTCVLANIASDSFTVDITPKKGDRVLVVYPRLFDPEMFTVPDSDNTKLIINPNARGYNLMSGIAILINQYKKASHKNLLKIADGYFSFAHKDGKTKIEVKDTGISIEDKNGCKIVTNDKGVTINGKLKIKV